MRNKITLVLGWLAATSLSIVIAAAAVGSVRDNVTDRPSRLAQPEAVAVATVATNPLPSTTTVTSTVTPSDTTADSTTVSPSTTAAPAPPRTSTTTLPSPPTTTTGPTWQLATYATDGGWVRVRYTSTVIELDASGPAPGYSAKVEHAGPSEVKVEFEGGDDEEYAISVKLEDGRPRVELED